MTDANSLEGRTVVDDSGNEYTVTAHAVEADELLIENEEERHAIVMMDIATGAYKFK